MITTGTKIPHTYNDAILLQQEVSMDLLLPSDQVKSLGHLDGPYIARVLRNLQLELEPLLLLGDCDVCGAGCGEIHNITEWNYEAVIPRELFPTTYVIIQSINLNSTTSLTFIHLVIQYIHMYLCDLLLVFESNCSVYSSFDYKQTIAFFL